MYLRNLRRRAPTEVLSTAKWDGMIFREHVTTLQSVTCAFYRPREERRHLEENRVVETLFKVAFNLTFTSKFTAAQQ